MVAKRSTGTGVSRGTSWLACPLPHSLPRFLCTLHAPAMLRTMGVGAREVCRPGDVLGRAAATAGAAWVPQLDTLFCIPACHIILQLVKSTHHFVSVHYRAIGPLSNAPTHPGGRMLLNSIHLPPACAPWNKMQCTRSRQLCRALKPSCACMRSTQSCPVFAPLRLPWVPLWKGARTFSCCGSCCRFVNSQLCCNVRRWAGLGLKPCQIQAGPFVVWAMGHGVYAPWL